MDREARLVELRATQETDLSGPIRLWLTDGIGGYWPPPRTTEFHRLFPAISIEVLCSQAPPEVGSMEADIISTWHPPTRPDLVVLSKNRMIFQPCASARYSNDMGCRAVLRT